MGAAFVSGVPTVWRPCAGRREKGEQECKQERIKELSDSANVLEERPRLFHFGRLY